MKKLYILSLFTLFSITPFLGQELFTCYDEYRKVFENRGAFEVKDGVHDDVILTIRKDGATDCYVCTVTIKESEVVEIAIYFEDNTKELIEHVYTDKGAWSIFNGISKTRTTDKDEKVNIMFTDMIKPKRKEFKKAPKPSFDLN